MLIVLGYRRLRLEFLAKLQIFLTLSQFDLIWFEFQLPVCAIMPSLFAAVCVVPFIKHWHRHISSERFHHMMRSFWWGVYECSHCCFVEKAWWEWRWVSWRWWNGHWWKTTFCWCCRTRRFSKQTSAWETTHLHFWWGENIVADMSRILAQNTKEVVWYMFLCLCIKTIFFTAKQKQWWYDNNHNHTDDSDGLSTTLYIIITMLLPNNILVDTALMKQIFLT